MPTHPCQAFFEAALRAFQRIALGKPPDCPQSILNALLENHLISRTVRVIDRDSLGPVLRYGYSVSQNARGISEGEQRSVERRE